MLKKTLFSIAISIFLLTLAGCGRVDNMKARALSKDYTYFVSITVDIDDTTDPYLYLWAKDVNLNIEKRELTVSEALITSTYASPAEPNSTSRDNFAIRIENARFSLPLGGKITIWKNGRKEVFERYDGYSKDEKY